jgi:heme/copper-type cytochrome/quinol oxidase subunit 4
MLSVLIFIEICMVVSFTLLAFGAASKFEIFTILCFTFIKVLVSLVHFLFLLLAVNDNCHECSR